MRLWPRLNSGRRKARPAIPPLGSWAPPNIGRWISFAASPMLERRHEQLGYEIETGRRDEVAAVDDALDDDVGDDLLRLVFTACHPVLPRDGQVALTLRLLCGLTTDEIARAFLVPEPTIAQRIVRAEEDARESERALRGAARGRSRRAADLRALRALPGLQRRLHGDCGPRLDAPHVVSARRCGWRGCCPSSRRTKPKCMGWGRS